VTAVTAEHSLGTYSGYVDIKRISLSTSALVAGVALTLPGVAPAEATSSLFPVDCQTNNVVLDEDNATYELYGTCGVVTVTGDNVTVAHLPATRRLVVEGRGATINGKPVDRVIVRGRDNQVTVRSSRITRIASPGSTVRVTGLLETGRVTGDSSRLRAERLTKVVVEGDRNLVRADRGTTVVRDEGRHNRIRVHRRA
jgi:hypothetical protein